jgi:ATP-dependent Clp protease ATP-binding subunit ClpC
VFERFDSEARSVITQAQEIARELSHNFIGTEHLLLGLEGTTGGDVLKALGCEFEALREGVLELVGRGPAPLVGAPAFTPRAKKVLELALREALARDERSIGPEHILLGIVREGEGVGAEVLAGAGVTMERLAIPLGWPQPRRRGRRFRRGPVTVGPAPTPAAAQVVFRAQALGVGGALASHHYLLGLFGDEQSLAAKVLDALGITREQVEAKIAEFGVAGTSDEPPVPEVPVDVAGERFEVTPEQAEQLRKWLSGEGPPPSAA